MSFRTVVISKRSKLDLKLNHMVVRSEETKKVLLDEISVLIIASTAVSLTSALISELIKNKTKIIFCDEKHLPAGEVMPYYDKHNTSKIIKMQINWKEESKDVVWVEIVKEKIKNQAALLTKLKLYREADLLKSYIDEVELKDKTNREGHAAKVYFNALFGMAFSRQNDNAINGMLNYGYAILLSMVSREITKNGYLTQLGIFHDNQFNAFNLASDIMEPLRPYIDRFVYIYNPEEFKSDDKQNLLAIFQENVKVTGMQTRFENAVAIYVRSVLGAIEEGDIKLINFIDYED